MRCDSRAMSEVEELNSIKKKKIMKSEERQLNVNAFQPLFEV
jgi:hypothetical protein